MEFKFPVVQAEGKEYTAEELYGKLSQEDSGYYLLSANQFWHGGVHFTSKHFAQHITDAPIQAIAKGTVIAYRINKDYLLIEDDEVIAVPPEKGGYQYSSGFCLIKHTIPYERKKTEQEKQQEIQQQVQQTTEQLKDQHITVQGSSPRTYRNEEGTTGGKIGTYPVGTKLDILSVSDAPKDGYYFAKVRETGKTAATDEHYIALLDKEGKPVANNDGKAFFELPASSTATFTAQQSAEQTTQNTNTQTSETTPTDTNNNQTDDTNKQEPPPTTFNLDFYSLYMHLCAYEDYLPPKKDQQQEAKPETITINATGLNVRDKQRDEANCTLLGTISNGATLEVLKSKVSSNKQFTDVKGKIISGAVTKGTTQVAKAGDTVWVPTKQGNKSFIKDNKQPTPKEKTRPSYWQGTVTAKVKKADGITIWKTYGNNELKAELGKINQGNQFTFDSTQTKIISQTGKPDLLVAECTAIGTFTFRGNGEQPTGTFWTTVDKDSIIREKVEPTVFDTVVPCQVEVIAGEGLGYLGIYETPSKMCEINKKRQVHVEIFTPDLKTVEFLLNNPFKLTGKKYIKIAKGTQLLGLLPAERPEPAIPVQTTPAPQASPIPDYTVTRDHYLAIDTLKAKKQLNGKEWYEIAVEKHTGYIAKEGLEEIDQHEWAKLGFQMVQEVNTNADGYLDPNLMPPIFQQIYNKIDTDGDGKLQQSELKAALQNLEIRDQWSKLIAFHPSEWKTDTKPLLARFTQLLTNPQASEEAQAAAKKLLVQETQRMNTLTFLEQVAPPIPPMLFHFHPVAFVEYLKGDGITAYHIYHDGRIEKHTPSSISSANKGKYLYIYHDKDNKEHNICTCEWHVTKKKKLGTASGNYNYPNHGTVLEAKAAVNEDSIEYRARYTNGNIHEWIKPLTGVSIYQRLTLVNGDIAEYGHHDTLGNIWRLYQQQAAYTELVRMPDSLDYTSGDVVIKYELQETYRKYTHPSILAGFIGALADIKEKITVTGSAYEQGSCFPSALHVNGESIDNKYIKNVNGLSNWDKDKTFVRALSKFHFQKFRIGSSMLPHFSGITGCVNGGTLHNSHLHTEDFKFSAVKQVTEDSRIELAQLSLSEQGKEFIKEWEGFREFAYNDSKGFCTIGYGHLIARDKCKNITLPAEFANGIKKPEANELFERRIPIYEKGVKDNVTVKLYQHEFDALVSLLFNCGENFFTVNKAPRLIQNLNDGNYQAAAHEFLDIENASRRRSENNLFLNNIYDASH